MDQALKTVESWLPWLMFLLPTIIVGLTRYKETQGVAAALRFVLNALSLVQHSDSPGSLKFPLVQSTPPSDFAKQRINVTQSLVKILPLIALASGLSACAAMQRYAIDLAACAAGQAPSEVRGYVDVAAKILLDGAPNHQQQLRTMGNSIGVTFVQSTIDCIVEAAVAQLAAPAPKGHAIGAKPVDPAKALEQQKQVADAVARGRAFLATRRR